MSKDKFEFPTPPHTELTKTQQRTAKWYAEQFEKLPPCAYGIFTFKREPKDLDEALGYVVDLCKRISGELHKPVWFWAAGERGGVNDRRHCHVFLFADPALEPRDYWVVRDHWRHGRIKKIEPYVPGGGAEFYMGWKMALGELCAWDMSKKLARRIGKFDSDASARSV